jgi:hypothetical protein
VSKFEFGDILKTTTLEEVYLGTLTRYYTFDAGRNVSRYTRDYDLRDCTLTKLSKPIKYHVFDTIAGQTKLSNFIDRYKVSYPDFKKSCPKRVITNKINLDITQEEFYKQLIEKIYDFDAWLDYYMKHYLSPTENVALYYFLGFPCFGVGTKPFELSNELMYRIKTAGIRYVEE